MNESILKSDPLKEVLSGTEYMGSGAYTPQEVRKKSDEIREAGEKILDKMSATGLVDMKSNVFINALPETSKTDPELLTILKDLSYEEQLYATADLLNGTDPKIALEKAKRIQPSEKQKTWEEMRSLADENITRGYSPGAAIERARNTIIAKLRAQTVERLATKIGLKNSNDPLEGL